jgi:hypothetical protein
MSLYKLMYETTNFYKIYKFTQVVIKLPGSQVKVLVLWLLLSVQQLASPPTERIGLHS